MSHAGRDGGTVGKQTPTMRLPPLGGPSASPIQARAAADPAAQAKAADDWMNAAIRPDLYPMPDLRSRADGPGRAMPAPVQAKMETALGADFSSVRIHESGQAAALGALAYTQGTNIHFAPGQYQPDTPQGQELLGHELTHVVQQSEGKVPAHAQAKGAPFHSDAALEREADERGARAARGEDARAGGAHTAAANHAGAPAQAKGGGTVGQIVTGVVGGMLVGGLFGLGAPAIAGMGLVGGVLGYALGGRSGNDTSRDDRSQHGSTSDRDRDDPEGTSPKNEGKNEGEVDDVEARAQMFGQNGHHLRERLKRSEEEHQAELAFLTADVAPSVQLLQDRASTLDRMTGKHEAIAEFLSKRGIFLASTQLAGTEAIADVIGKARHLVKVQQSASDQTIPEYLKFLRSFDEEEILTTKQLNKIYGPSHRLQARAKLAGQYGQALKTLGRLESEIQQSFQILSGNDLDLVIADINALCRALHRVRALERDQDEKQRDLHKKAKAKQGKSSPEDDQDEDPTDVVAPARPTDETSSRTIRIRGTNVAPNVQLTSAEQNKVDIFTALDGQSIPRRLRDLMNEHFGNFEFVNHHTIRLSKGNRLEFDLAVDDQNATLTIVNIGKPTYQH